MNDPITIYLEDHRAGAAFALDLLDSLKDAHADAPLSDFAAGLAAEIREDRDQLDVLIERLGPSGSGRLKRLVAVVAEKATWWKLRRFDKQGLGTFERLEILSLGILGKLALWRTLEARRDRDIRFSDLDLESLINRAQDQHARVEQRRIAAAVELPAAGD